MNYNLIPVQFPQEIEFYSQKHEPSTSFEDIYPIQCDDLLSDASHLLYGSYSYQPAHGEYNIPQHESHHSADELAYKQQLCLQQLQQHYQQQNQPYLHSEESITQSEYLQDMSAPPLGAPFIKRRPQSLDIATINRETIYESSSGVLTGLMLSSTKYKPIEDILTPYSDILTRYVNMSPMSPRDNDNFCSEDLEEDDCSASNYPFTSLNNTKVELGMLHTDNTDGLPLGYGIDSSPPQGLSSSPSPLVVQEQFHSTSSLPSDLPYSDIEPLEPALNCHNQDTTMIKGTYESKTDATEMKHAKVPRMVPVSALPKSGLAVAKKETVNVKSIIELPTLFLRKNSLLLNITDTPGNLREFVDRCMSDHLPLKKGEGKKEYYLQMLEKRATEKLFASRPRHYKCPYKDCIVSHIGEKSENNLKNHITSKHIKRSFACRFCSYKYSRSDAEKRHAKKCHGKKYLVELFQDRRKTLLHLLSSHQIVARQSILEEFDQVVTRKIQDVHDKSYTLTGMFSEEKQSEESDSEDTELESFKRAVETNADLWQVAPHLTKDEINQEIENLQGTFRDDPDTLEVYRLQRDVEWSHYHNLNLATNLSTEPMQSFLLSCRERRIRRFSAEIRNKAKYGK